MKNIHDLEFDLQRFAEGEPEPTPPAEPPAPPAEPPASEPPAEPAKPDEPAPPAEPVKYEFKLPEGISIDPEINTELQTILNGAKVPPEQAQALVDLQVKLVQKQQKTVEEYVAKERAETEKFLGTGAERSAREENIGRGKSIIDPDGELMQLFDAAHLGNNAVLAKALERIGSMAKEGTFISGKPAGEKAWGETMYTLDPNNAKT